jgi:hypothetical protein
VGGWVDGVKKEGDGSIRLDQSIDRGGASTTTLLNESINQSINRSINQSINQSINRPIMSDSQSVNRSILLSY